MDVPNIKAEGKNSNEKLRRKIATVCYLIDRLKLRVGDEKDKDEADTVGATTLRPTHVKIVNDETVILDFIGKDYVRWHRKVKMPKTIVKNFKKFMEKAKSPIFKGVRSKNVSQFLDEILPGLTAKVFRTFHASKEVKEYLSNSDISKE